MERNDENIKKMNYHENDRAQRLLDVFPLKEGQINISYINSTEHIVAWHKHEKQTDYWICIKGSLKVGWALKIVTGKHI